MSENASSFSSHTSPVIGPCLGVASGSLITGGLLGIVLITDGLLGIVLITGGLLGIVLTMGGLLAIGLITGGLLVSALARAAASFADATCLTLTVSKDFCFSSAVTKSVFLRASG